MSRRQPARRPRRAAATLLLSAGLAAGLACSGARAVRERVAPSSPRARYAMRLDDAGLATSALGRDWAAAGDAALAARTPVAPPWREAGFLSRDEARAVAAVVRVRRGQQLRVRLRATADEPATLFVDLFRLRADGPPELVRGAAVAARTPRDTAAADSAPLIATDADRDAVYVVRLQAELLRAVRYDATVEAGASLGFPVAGRDARATESFFGDERDAGARRHEGVDIFAPRGTPAVAAVDGTVRDVGLTSLGGKVVWLQDAAHGQSLYYAHLDTQLVHAGDRVRAGDTLGRVGNTGNARTTPPHLHFGVYVWGRGAVDPYPFVNEPRRPPAAPPEVAVGTWRRLARRAPLRVAPDDAAAALGDLLPALEALRADAALARGWLRVRTADGRAGFVSVTATEPAEGAPLAHRTAAPVRDRPDAAAVIVADSVPVTVLARTAGFDLVRTPDGRTGWADRSAAR